MEMETTGGKRPSNNLQHNLYLHHGTSHPTGTAPATTAGPGSTPRHPSGWNGRRPNRSHQSPASPPPPSSSSKQYSSSLPPTPPPPKYAQHPPRRRTRGTTGGSGTGAAFVASTGCRSTP